MPCVAQRDGMGCVQGINPWMGSQEGLDTVPLLTVLHTQFHSLFLSFPFPEVGQC